MRIYKTQEDVNTDLVYGDLIIEDDITFLCDIKLDGSIRCENLIAKNLNVAHLDVKNLKAKDIDCYDLDAHDITAHGIDADDIDAHHIKTTLISAWTVRAYSCTAKRPSIGRFGDEEIWFVKE